MKQFAALCIAASLIFNPVNASAALLQKGTYNNDVKRVQIILKQLGYFKYPKITGYFGSITVNAVRKFQQENGLAADGIIGDRTKRVLFGNINTDNIPAIQPVQKIDGALDWFKEVQYIWSIGTNAIVTDVDTGKSFELRRTYGYNHADVEPLTKKDSAIVKEIWNGWSWERRAVIVNVGGKLLAGSMTAMPHAGLDSAPAGALVRYRSAGYGTGYNLDAIKNNGANGVMDIHFLNSRTHSTNVLQKSQQDMVKKADQYIQAMTKLSDIKVLSLSKVSN
jgi:hypothetical protein